MKNKSALFAILAAIVLFIAWPVYGKYYDVYGTNGLFKGDILVKDDAVIEDDTTVKDLYIEGATADDYETCIAVEDPTADRTFTLPDYDGSAPVIVDQSGASKAVVNSNTDVEESAVTPQAGWWVDGKTLKWEVAGTITGSNAAKVFKLRVGLTDITTITLDPAAIGDYLWTTTVQRGDDTVSGVTEIAVSTLEITSGASRYSVTDFGTSGVSDFGSGTTCFRLEVTSGNAGDWIYTRMLRIWHWFKS